MIGRASNWSCTVSCHSCHTSCHYAVFFAGKDSDKFTLDPGNGDIYLATDKLDREEKEVYYLRLKATDSAGNIGEGQLVIHVTDRNDHQPKFIKLQVLDSRLVSVAKDKVWVGSGVGAPVLDMSETVPPGTRIARVLAGKSLTTKERNKGETITKQWVICPPWHHDIRANIQGDL